jgi:hypothetical membrane protein
VMQIPFKGKAVFSSGSNQLKQGTWLALVAIGGILYFVAAVVVLHVLRPELNPVSHAVSNYAIGSFGFLMISAFFTLALSEFALALGLARSLTNSRSTFISVLLLSLAGVGLVVTGIFPGDVKSLHPPGTATAIIHWTGAGTSFLSVMIAAFLLASCYKTDLRWQSFHRPALVLAITTVLALVAFGLLAIVGWVGVGERIYIAVIVLWLVAASVRLLATNKTEDTSFT